MTFGVHPPLFPCSKCCWCACSYVVVAVMLLLTTEKVIEITPLWRKSELLDAEVEFVFLFIFSYSDDSSGFAHTGLYAYNTK